MGMRAIAWADEEEAALLAAHAGTPPIAMASLVDLQQAPICRAARAEVAVMAGRQHVLISGIERAARPGWGHGESGFKRFYREIDLLLPLQTKFIGACCIVE